MWRNSAFCVHVTAHNTRQLHLEERSAVGVYNGEGLCSLWRTKWGWSCTCRTYWNGYRDWACAPNRAGTNKTLRVLIWTVETIYTLFFSFFLSFFSWRYNPHGGLYFTALWRALASSLARFHDHIQRRATVGRTPLNEWSVRRIDLYLTTQHSTHKHPSPGWDSNPRSQQASDRRPTP